MLFPDLSYWVLILHFRLEKMKKIKLLFGIIGFVILSITTLSCGEEFLDLKPTASLNPEILNNLEGLDALLLAAYSGLDGSFENAGVTGFGWQNDYTNWLYGSITSDDALKGTSIGDQPDMNPIELWSTLTPANAYLTALWGSVYEGISRANAVLQIFANTEGLSDADKARIYGEAHFLRAHYHHYGRRYFGIIPYIDETAVDFRVPNDRDISADIEADYLVAIENLPVDPSVVGKAHKSAAQASLAKLYMDNAEYSKAKPLLDAIISSGRYILFPNYNENFIWDNEGATTGTEKIFQIQSSVRAGRNTLDGRLVNGIGQLHGCCGFFQPSQNLVNAHKTDANGLPMLDTYNDVDLHNDQGIETADPFTPASDNLDPRLDFTVGRRGIPYLDFEINLLPAGPGNDLRLFPGKAYVVDQQTYGPYRTKKLLPTKAEQDATDGGFLGTSIVNHSIHRYADILLLRAEVAVEENDLSSALMYVNMVRNRAKTGEVVRFADGTPAANYVIEPYPDFPDQTYARKAVHHERRLELALEGKRWYDLVRWGIAEEIMSDYYATEDRPLLNEFGAYKSDFLPLPGGQIDISRDDDGNPTLIQNPDY